MAKERRFLVTLRAFEGHEVETTVEDVESAILNDFYIMENVEHLEVKEN